MPSSDLILGRDNERFAVVAGQQGSGGRVADEGLPVVVDRQPRADRQRLPFDIHAVFGQVLAGQLEVSTAFSWAILSDWSCRRISAGAAGEPKRYAMLAK